MRNTEESVKQVPGGWLARFRCGKGGPRLRVVIRVADKRLALARCRKMREVIQALAKCQPPKTEEALAYLEQGAAALDSPAFHGITTGAMKLVKGEATVETGVATFRDVCERWLSGELHQLYPGLIKFQSAGTAANSRARIVRHIYPIMGDMAVHNIKQQHYNAVMASLPASLQRRDKLAGFMWRVMKYAVKLKHIQVNPFDSDSMPRARKWDAVAFTYLYPEEETRLLREGSIPFGRRFFYGLIVRCGFRTSEAGRLRKRDFDPKTGMIRCIAKGGRFRSFVVGADVRRALILHTEGMAPGDLLFPWYDRHGLSAQLQRDLRVAGIDRPDAIDPADAYRRPLRVHDLRATFVTLALAAGQTERWVMTRTGHTTSAMISRYDRAKRTAVEAGHDQWVPALDALLWPEAGPKGGSGVGHSVGHDSTNEPDLAESSSSSTTVDPLLLLAGTKKPGAKRAPASTNNPGGPPAEGGWATIAAGLTSAIAAAAAAGKWSAVERLTAQLERLEAEA